MAISVWVLSSCGAMVRDVTSPHDECLVRRKKANEKMTTMFGVLRVLAPEADAGHPAPGHVIPDSRLAFPIAQESISLGRALHNTIVLFDLSVAEEHACLYYTHGDWTIENLTETSLLRVEETIVPPTMLASVAPGQHITIGDMHLQLVASDVPLHLMALMAEPPSSSRVASTSMVQRIWQPASGGWGRLGLLAVAVAFIIALILVSIGLGTLITHRVLSGGIASVLAALVLPLVPAVGIVTLIALIDRYEREPWYLLLSAFLWGAIIAIPPALFIENSLNHWITLLPANLLPRMWGDLTQSALFGLNAGITEEAVKGAGLLALLFIVRDRFENITDGILYGAVIGAGFAMTENIVYFVTADSSRKALVFLIIGRVILGWLGHSTFTACFGAALGYMREGRAGFRPWLPPLVGFVAAVFLHSLFDFVDFQANTAVHDAPGSAVVNILALIAVIADYIPLFATQFVLFVMLMRSLARESGILREFLVDEVRQGIVTAEEYLALQRASVGQRFRRSLLLLQGMPLWLATRTLFTTEVGLAFTKWRVSLLPAESPLPFAPPTAYRARIRRLRRTLHDIDQADEHTPTPLFPYPYGLHE